MNKTNSQTVEKNLFDYTGPILFIVSFLFLYFVSHSSPFFLFNNEIDGNIYFTLGKGMMRGVVPYRDLFDHKGPVLYFLHGIGYLLDNYGMTGIYIIQSLFMGSVLVFFYKIALLFIKKEAALISAIIAGVAYTAMLNTSGGPEEFCILFMTISFYIFIKHFKKENSPYLTPKELLGIGITAGLTFFTKYNLCAFWLIFLLFIFGRQIQDKNFKKTISQISILAGGFILSLLPFIIYFAANSALKDLYQCYFGFNSAYASLNFSVSSLLNFFVCIIMMLHQQWLFTIFMTLGLMFLYLSPVFTIKRAAKAVIILSALMIFTILYMPGRFHDYYSQALLPFAVFPAIGLTMTALRVADSKKPSQHAIYCVILIAFLTALKINPTGINYVIERNSGRLLFQDYILEFQKTILSDKNPTLLIVGRECELYTLTNLLPPIKYFYFPVINYELFPQPLQQQTESVAAGKTVFIYHHQWPRISFEYTNTPNPIPGTLFLKNYKTEMIFSSQENGYPEHYNLLKRKE